MNITSIIRFLTVIAIYSLFWTIVAYIIAITFKNIFSPNKEEIKETINEENNNLKIESKKITLDKEPSSNKETLEIKINTKEKSDENKFETQTKSKSQTPKKDIDKPTTKPTILKEKNKAEEKYIQTSNKNNDYYIEYLNEVIFRKKERAIKKYNMLAYKKLIFDYYPSLRKGNFQGILISSKENGKIQKYELILPTDKIFIKVHGNITLHYTVYVEQKKVVLETLTPEDVLTEGHEKELTTYKGVMISKSHKDTEMFKINLLNMLDK